MRSTCTLCRGVLTVEVHLYTVQEVRVLTGEVHLYTVQEANSSVMSILWWMRWVFNNTEGWCFGVDEMGI